MFVKCVDSKGLLLSLVMSSGAVVRTWSLLVVVAQLERFLFVLLSNGRLRVMEVRP